MGANDDEPTRDGHERRGSGAGAPTRPGTEPIDSLLEHIAHELSVEAERFAALIEDTKRYRLGALLGQGAMGAVYRAYDTVLERNVALKVLHEDDPPTAERFLREARAQARVEHEHICKVYEAGTAGGASYIVMQYVAGETLAAAGKHMSLAHKLEVMRTVSDAVHAAHRSGLVHRDVKPQNIMVERLADGRPKPYVLDFGLAREKGVPGVTATGQMIGTPHYMSPEQARGDVERIDVRSDVYSLGATLYELLVGEPPFAGSGTAEIVARVLTTDPVSARKRDRRVPVDLDTIVMKCLERDPERRYASAGALADDLRRHIAGEPIAARRAGPIERLGRRVRRNKLLAAVVAVAVLAVGVSAVLVYRQSRARVVCSGAERKLRGIWDPERRRAVQAAFATTRKPFAPDAWAGTRRGLDAYTQAWVTLYEDSCTVERVQQAVLDLRLQCLGQRLDDLQALTDLFAAADGLVLEKSVAAVLALDPLASCADPVALAARQPPSPDPSTRSRIEALRLELSQTKALLGAGKYAAGLGLGMPLAAAAGQLPDRALEGEALFVLGQLEEKAVGYAAALRSMERALAAAEAGRDDRMAAQAAVAVAGLRFHDEDEARRWGELAAALIQRGGGDDVLTARLLLNRAWTSWDRARYEDSLAQSREALGLLERSLPADHPALVPALNLIGATLETLGRPADAIAVEQRAVAIAEAALGASHPELAAPLINLGSALRRAGRLADAGRALERAGRALEPSVEPQHPNVAKLLLRQGELALDEGRLDDADSCFARARALREQHFGPTDPSVAVAIDAEGRVRRERGQPEAAVELHRRAIGIMELAHPRGEAYVQMLEHLGEADGDLGQPAQAEALQRRALALAEAQIGLESPEAASALTGLADALAAQGRADEAIAASERALRIVESALGQDHPQVAVVLLALGRAQLSAGTPQLALAPLERARLIRERSDPGRLAAVQFALARALWDAGDRERALSLAALARADYSSRRPAPARALAEVETWLARRPDGRAR
jgi:tetratricopeptide (TPR) repeat protein/predicted Ser/Thr protein kinase